jgi:hypothetical protein
MCGAFGTRDGGEIAIVQSFRLTKHRRADGNGVAPGELPNDLQRCVANRREPFAQFRERRLAGLVQHRLHQVIEQGDMNLAELRGAIEKQIGHAAQQHDALGAGCGFERRLDIAQQRFRYGLMFRGHAAPGPLRCCSQR